MTATSPLNTAPEVEGFRLQSPPGDSTVHLNQADLPWLEGEDGTKLQLLHVDLNQGLWVLNVRWPPGRRVATHYHTGPVYAVTRSGCWYYAEYPDTRNTAGSYLYEPAHSTHTLLVPEDITEETEVWFAIHGANIDLDGEGRVLGVLDARTILERWQQGCAAAGLDGSATLITGL